MERFLSVWDRTPLDPFQRWRTLVNLQRLIMLTRRRHDFQRNAERYADYALQFSRIKRVRGRRESLWGTDSSRWRIAVREFVNWRTPWLWHDLQHHSQRHTHNNLRFLYAKQVGGEYGHGTIFKNHPKRHNSRLFTASVPSVGVPTASIPTLVWFRRAMEHFTAQQS